MYRWYVLWVDVQVNLQSSDRLIKITQTESGAVPVMAFLQCHAILFSNKLQRIMYSWRLMGRCAIEFTIERPINYENSDWKRGDSCYDVTLPYM